MSTLPSSIVRTKSLGPHNPIHVYDGDVDIASVGVAGTAPVEQDITVTGLKSTDVLLSVTCTDANFFLAIGNARIKADDTLAVVLHNTDDAAVDPAATCTLRVVAAAG